MRSRPAVACSGVLALLIGFALAPLAANVAPAGTPAAGAARCPVTTYVAAGLDDSFTGTWYGGDGFWAGVDQAHNGRWYAGPDFMKVQWRRPAGRPLTITGRRLDAPAPPLQVSIPRGYPGGDQPSALTFPTAGCWEVVGRIPGKELRFVVFVHSGQENPLATPPSRMEAAVAWADLRRPLHLPALAPGSAWPAAKGGAVSRIEGVAFGGGPVYLEGLAANGRLYLGKAPVPGVPPSIFLRVIVSPAYSAGPLLLRWDRIGDATPPAGSPRVGSEVRLVVPTVAPPDWWIVRLGNLGIPGPGCYGVQIDGRSFSEVVVFDAVPGLAPGAATTPQPGSGLR